MIVKEKLFYFFIVTFLLSIGVQGCSGFTEYNYRNVYSMTAPVESSEKVFSDENVSVRFWIDEKKIHFDLKNLTEDEMVIDWRKASFVNYDGSGHSVASMNTIFSDRRDRPEPSVIKAGEKTRELVVPVKNVEKLESWTWYVYPLFNLKDGIAYENKGKTIGIDLPVEVRGKLKTYAFRFEVTHVIPVRERAM